MDSPADFLAGRDKTPLGFLEVLKCIGVKPGHADKIPLLRQKVDELTNLTERFHANFMELSQWRTISPQDVRETVDRLSEMYTAFCILLGAFCTTLGMEEEYSQQADQDKYILDSWYRLHEHDWQVPSHNTTETLAHDTWTV